MKIFEFKIRTRLLFSAIQKITALKRYGFFIMLLLPLISLQAQTPPKVAASIDSTTIKIGEQINFELKIEADTASFVDFPKGQTFLPLEVFDSTAIDTFKNRDRYTLTRTYALTQFDSGNYIIPKQRIIIDKIDFFTDSIPVRVNDVVVDTTKQGMFDIKELITVDKSYGSWLPYLFWILGILLVVGALLYWFVFRKKPLTEEEKVALLPPFDRAILELKKLEESKYLIQSEYKQYYSELTDIVRSYLEEDVHISALESTTEELIEKMELLKDSGNLSIDDETIKQFKNVLQTADLVKFAKSKPENRIAESDRNLVEQIVVKTKEALPEPTEEELRENEEYLEMLAKKKRKKKILITGIVSLFVIIVATGVAIGYYGFNKVKDTVIGHPTKDLLEGDWIASEYGYPVMYVETPKVLKRIRAPFPEETLELISTNQSFYYGSIVDHFYILISSSTYKEGTEIDLIKSVDGTVGTLEAQGAKNILKKIEEFETPTGKRGVKSFGSMKITDEESEKEISAKYVILGFAENGGFQQLVITYEADDDYAEGIVNRITNSIDFKVAE